MEHALKSTYTSVAGRFWTDRDLRSTLVQLVAVLALAALVLTSFFPQVIWDTFVELSVLITWGKQLLNAKSRSLGGLAENLIDLAIDQCNQFFKGA